MPELIPGGPDVSRETLERLRRFHDLACAWTTRINLLSAKDRRFIWERHIIDSAQLVGLAETPESWLDLGSGGGFPGIVAAIMLDGGAHVTLVESDTRKCVFLNTVARQLDLTITVLPRRIEKLEETRASTLSARALAPLVSLVAHADKFLGPGGTALFPKGRNWKSELELAKGKWSFDCDVIQSITDSRAAIVKLRNVKRI